LAIGTIAAWYSYSKLAVKNPVDNSQTEVKINNDLNKQQIEIYGINDQLALVPTTIQIEKGKDDQESLTVAFNKLLTGLDSNNITTAIPENTKLTNLTVKDDGIHIDLSSEFTTGGGSASMISRLGQVIYTASSVNPSVNVWISVEGKPLNILGEEGLIVEQPMTRGIFMESFPSPN
ncbi:GerMN domain-containing protein, partial [Geminocystis sp. GBBB08]|uniref:GerMN domain-containing protein n=1 Tax=Geminocystis sp. GBBB08 TaxID=2604140 RepID=UPI0027E2982C